MWQHVGFGGSEGEFGRSTSARRGSKRRATNEFEGTKTRRSSKKRQTEATINPTCRRPIANQRFGIDFEVQQEAGYSRQEHQRKSIDPPNALRTICGSQTPMLRTSMFRIEHRFSRLQGSSGKVNIEQKRLQHKKTTTPKGPRQQEAKIRTTRTITRVPKHFCTV